VKSKSEQLYNVHVKIKTAEAYQDKFLLDVEMTVHEHTQISPEDATNHT